MSLFDFSNWQFVTAFITFISIILFAVTAALNAVMDVVDQYGKNTVFILHGEEGTTKKIFGIPWNLWFNYDRGWLNKYEDRDPDKPIRTINIFSIKIEFTVFSDCWHFSKMLMLGFFIINFLLLFSGLIYSAYLIVQSGDSLSLNLLLWFVPLLFVLYSIAWNLVFNYLHKNLKRSPGSEG
ncbi:MAG: hypothetical protein Kow0098_03540 [Ignavibacteriaceae bacterium]